MIKSPQQLRSLFPFAPIRAKRITRLEETVLGDFAFDGETAEMLGRERIGIFMGNCGSVDRIIDRLKQLVECPFEGKFVVLSSSNELASRMQDEIGGGAIGKAARQWEKGCVVFTTPEGLKWFSGNALQEETVAIILVDPACYVHSARGGPSWGRNDRPQNIVDFRLSLEADGWMPPLFVLTLPPAKSLNTQRILSPYCLDGWWFLDGYWSRFGQPPSAAGGWPASARTEGLGWSGA